MLSILSTNEAATVMEIERLVSQIIKNECKRAANPEQRVGEGLEEVCRAFGQSMGTYLSVYYPDCEYSEHLEAFWAGCRVAGLLDEATGEIVEESWTWPSPEQVEIVIVEIIRIVNDEKFKRRVSDRRYQATEKNRHIRQYAAALHEHYSRLLVVRVDWGYRKEEEYRVGINDVYCHLDAMIKSITNRVGVFENLVGYAWCIEQGVSRGYHLHTVFYFPGSDHQNDWYMAKQIGEQWISVTEGLGAYHSCNTPAEKEKYDGLGKLGVGMIHRRDEVACANAVDVVSYLADPEKEDQYLRIKPLGRRAFATGQLPKARLEASGIDTVRDCFFDSTLRKANG